MAEPELEPDSVTYYITPVPSEWRQERVELFEKDVRERDVTELLGETAVHITPAMWRMLFKPLPSLEDIMTLRFAPIYNVEGEERPQTLADRVQELRALEHFNTDARLQLDAGVTDEMLQGFSATGTHGDEEARLEREFAAAAHPDFLADEVDDEPMPDGNWVFEVGKAPYFVEAPKK